MRYLLFLLLGVFAQANAEIYKCIEEGGRVTYSNSAMKNCARLNVGPPSTTVSGTKSFSGSSNARSGAGAEGFPRVDSNQQRARDDERRRILDLELAGEQSALDTARNALVEQEAMVLPEERNAAGRGINGAKVELRVQPYRDRVALHERNIEALRREIANLR